MTIINDYISLAEMQNCVHMAVELCFDNNVYQPVMRDYALWYSIAYFFTDIDSDNLNVNEEYEKICDTNFRSAMKSNNQVRAIVEAFEETVEEKRHPNKLRDFMNDILTKIDNPETMAKLVEWGEELGVVENEKKVED